MEWQLQEAKAKFSELVQKAIDDGPQTVTRRGQPAVVVLSAEQFELMKKRQIEPQGSAALGVARMTLDLEREQGSAARADL